MVRGRSARRGPFAYGVALLLAGGALALSVEMGRGGGAAGAARSEVIVEAGLVAPGLGWAMNGLGLWWTGDGGTHWRVMTPPHVAATGDVVARVVDVAAVDDRHVWISAADIQGNRVVNGATRHMEIERTVDGGRTWRSSIPPGCYGCGATHLSFVDGRTGFALAASQPDNRLFRTSDGGASWQRVADHHFRDRSHAGLELPPASLVAEIPEETDDFPAGRPSEL